MATRTHSGTRSSATRAEPAAGDRMGAQPGGMPAALSNRLVSNLLSEQRIQRKGRDAEGAGDQLEQEADRAAESIAGPAASAAPGAAPGSGNSSAPAALLADDEALQVETGQMRKSDFLAEVRTAVCATADEGLQASGQTAQGCPWIEYWLSYYGGQDASHVERALHKFAPVAAGVTSARDYIPMVAARVRQGVDRYAKTGETPDLPDGMAEGMAGGGLLGAVGSVFFKAREGGAQASQDPQAIRGQLGAGQPLESGVRSRMESAFGTGFSEVRVHTDSPAAALSDGMNARAFTVGEHVAFSPGEYRPETPAGQALIAHELAHVVQQGGAVQQSSRSGASYSALEEDADSTAVRAVVSILSGAGRGLANVGRQALPRLKSGLQLQRCGKVTQESLGEHAVACMAGANTGHSKTSGVWYASVYKAKYPSEWKDAYAGGYANPEYWERIGDNMQWRLRKRRSASEGLKAWFAGLTIAECYSTAIVCEVDSIRDALGNSKFDDKFGSKEKDVEPRLEMGMDGSNALEGRLTAVDVRQHGEAGTMGHRPVSVGDWCYFYNHPRYLLKHPSGIFQGENAMLLEDHEAPKVQIWEGLGESKRTEEAMYQDMFQDYNRDRDADDLADLEGIRVQSGGTLPEDYSKYPEKLKSPNDILTAPAYLWIDPWGKHSDTEARKGGFDPVAQRLDVTKVQELKDQK